MENDNIHRPFRLVEYNGQQVWAGPFYGYKAFILEDNRLRCIDYIFSELEANILNNNNPLIQCKNGFHFGTSIEAAHYWYKHYTQSYKVQFCKIKAYNVLPLSYLDEYDRFPLSQLPLMFEKHICAKIEIIERIDSSIVQEKIDIFHSLHQSKGSFNTGNSNEGNFNSGMTNLGNRNTGNYNIGDYNTGGHNYGSKNTGNWNYGSNNVGDFNLGSYNIGMFNTLERSKNEYMFNKRLTKKQLVSLNDGYVKMAIASLKYRLKSNKPLSEAELCHFAKVIPNATKGKIKKLHDGMILHRAEIDKLVMNKFLEDSAYTNLYQQPIRSRNNL